MQSPAATGPSSDAHQWRRRAMALEAEVQALRDRLLALARVLPLEWIELLGRDAEEILEQAPLELFAEGNEAQFAGSPSVAVELERAWARLASQKLR